MPARFRLPVAIMLAVVVAEAAVLVMRPREGVIDPVPVRPSSYFSAQQIDRAEDYRGSQRLLVIGILVVELGVLTLLVARPPARLRGPFRRPVLVAAAAGAALSVSVSTAPLPLQIVNRERSVEVGLVTQSWGGYAQDRLISTGIGALLAGVGAAAAVGLMRRAPRRWWVAGSAVVVLFGAGSVYAGPIVLDPLFNDFEELPEGRTRADVLDLARRAGVDVGEVYRIDASRRTTAANAYVTGLGHTKRVVLYDTLIDNFDRDQFRLVVAHELGHVHYDDVPRGLLFLLIIAPPALFAAAQMTRRMAPHPGPSTTDRVGPEVLPALALSIALMTFLVTTVSNQLSRDVEARADSYAVKLTGEPGAHISFERRLAIRNVSDPDPPGWWSFLQATHPDTLERIGIGEAFKRGER